MSAAMPHENPIRMRTTAAGGIGFLLVEKASKKPEKSEEYPHRHPRKQRDDQAHFLILWTTGKFVHRFLANRLSGCLANSLAESTEFPEADKANGKQDWAANDSGPKDLHFISFGF
jgi:hypothetical protein